MLTLDEAQKVFAKSANCSSDDAVRSIYDIAVRAQQEQAGWGRLRLEALGALGRYLIRNGRGPGRPSKSSDGEDKQTLAHLGITDHHISSDAKHVARIPQRVFDDYLAIEPEPTLAGLMRHASPPPCSATVGKAEPSATRTPSRASPMGIATNDLILSASVEGNAAVFAQILTLYVKPGSIIADVTRGRGIFWTNVPENVYELRATDIKTGTDCRALPYETETIDCVVFDPPYMHSPGGTAHVDHQNFEDYYGNNEPVASDLKYHDAVLDLYFRAADEARRVLR